VKRDDEKPKILSARFGVNPNSSSLGVDVTFLIFGGAATIAATLLLSVLLRSKKGKAEVHGDEGAVK
jgi:hypothetical protein